MLDSLCRLLFRGLLSMCVARCLLCVVMLIVGCCSLADCRCSLGDVVFVCCCWLFIDVALFVLR